MSEQRQFYAAVLVAVLLAVLGAIQVADPVSLGLTSRVAAWLGVASAGLGVLASFLPSVRRRPEPPAEPHG